MSNYSHIPLKNRKPQDSFLSSGRMLDPLVPYAKQYRTCVPNRIRVTEQAMSREEKETELFFVLKNEQHFLLFQL